MGSLDYVSLGADRAGIVSIRPIVPSSDIVQQLPGTEYLMVSVRYLAGSLLEEIQASTELFDLEFETSVASGDDRIRRPVLDADGRIVGFFSWVPEEPAYELITETAPVIAFGILAAALAVSILLRRLKRTSTKLEATEAKASYLAFHDPLTGIPNRALFEDRLDQALANMRRTGSMVALHYIDLDRFKHINDTLGHPAGDELIRTASKRLAALVDEVDTVARLGGDEFAIIQFQPHDVAAAEGLSQRVVESLSAPVPIAGVEALVGASVGVIVTADASADAADLMRQADIALYQAKDNGRGRYQLFAGEMDEAVKERHLLEIELRAALATGTGLALVYQPIFSSTDGSLSGVEALVRWNHPTRGLLAPNVFITLAEERGLIDQLGLWVLRSACLFVATSDLPWVAVNVSPMQFRSERFAQSVLTVLRETGISPHRLQIEITEGLLLQNSPVIQTILTELRASGIRIALDDFGTGYSSISYLRNHGIDKLKIDQSFTALLGKDPQIESIIKSIVDLGRSMNMVVTAEGVETPMQKSLLINIGCDELQGYLLSKPVPPEQLSSRKSLSFA
ncbi:putative bifunctional diguanylate cyclase/phosphodiesterase [Devosia aurantiaca]|uniref:EAL domain-containing protein n=1 Tax=Devosia aurantiaca TaxID=2714858 RepID=A0A6M1S9L5_9HYPH|nr:EAL domain-containing protein [Devosia aurantiaca]NGP16497.1 EAL domain-containing protein [Devosia aurantiaca]